MVNLRLCKMARLTFFTVRPSLFEFLDCGTEIETPYKGMAKNIKSREQDVWELNCSKSRQFFIISDIQFNPYCSVLKEISVFYRFFKSSFSQLS